MLTPRPAGHGLELAGAAALLLLLVDGAPGLLLQRAPPDMEGAVHFGFLKLGL